MRERLIHFLATGLGVGLSPYAPGTTGSLLGLAYWWLLLQAQSAWVYGLVLVAGVAFSVWCAGEAAQAMRKSDPPSVVIDEIAAVPLALAGLGVQPLWPVIAAFVLFRLFDALKPAPVRQAQNFTGGLGIVLDDLVAAAYACGVTHGLVWLVGWLRR